MMRILHITPYYKPADQFGGPIVTISHLAEAQQDAGAEVVVFTTNAGLARTSAIPLKTAVSLGGVNAWYFPGTTAFKGFFSPALLWKLWQNAGAFDVIHLHTWWNWIAFGTALICRLKGIPLVLSPHGMLSPYSFRNRMRHLFQRFVGNYLLATARLHATSPQESAELKALLPSNTIFEIPCFVDFPPKMTEKSEKATIFHLLFLSRIHPKKGLEYLLEALPGLNYPWRLTIAGNGEPAYEQTLREKIEKQGIAPRVTWAGWVSGAAKWGLLAEADLLVLPSYNENFAIVVLEALALGIPVMVSEHVGVGDYVRQNDFGWLVNLDAENIRAKLDAAWEEQNKWSRIHRDAPAYLRRDFDPGLLTQQFFEHYQKHSSKK